MTALIIALLDHDLAFLSHMQRLLDPRTPWTEGNRGG